MDTKSFSQRFLGQLGVFNKQIQQVTDFIEDNTGIQIDSSNLQGSIDIQQEIQDALNQLGLTTTTTSSTTTNSTQ